MKSPSKEMVAFLESLLGIQSDTELENCFNQNLFFFFRNFSSNPCQEELSPGLLRSQKKNGFYAKKKTKTSYDRLDRINEKAALPC